MSNHFANNKLKILWIMPLQECWMNLTVDLQTTTGVLQQVSRLYLFHLLRPSCRFCSNGDGDSLWLMMTITDMVLAQHVIIFLCPISVHF
jgi:hypothetical protein